MLDEFIIGENLLGCADIPYSIFCGKFTPGAICGI